MRQALQLPDREVEIAIEPAQLTQMQQLRRETLKYQTEYQGDELHNRR